MSGLTGDERIDKTCDERMDERVNGWMPVPLSVSRYRTGRGKPPPGRCAPLSGHCFTAFSCARPQQLHVPGHQPVHHRPQPQEELSGLSPSEVL